MGGLVIGRVGEEGAAQAHQGQFLICRNCHAAIELEQEAISRAIVDSAREVGFSVEQQTVEVVGICAGCRAA